MKGDKSIVVDGNLALQGKTVELVSDTTMKIESGAHMDVISGSTRHDDTSGNHHVDAAALFVEGRDGVLVNSAKIHTYGKDEIHLQVGGSAIHITAGGIKITSSGDVEINGGLVKLNCQ